MPHIACNCINQFTDLPLPIKELTMTDRKAQIAALEKDWAENPRWKLVKRGYSAADVVLKKNLAKSSGFMYILIV